MAKDPVCGMEIDERTAAGQSEYKGTTYYFCAPGCKRAFDQRPEKCVKPKQTDATRSTGDHGGYR
jgi:Cu+-exporting ATPase